MAGDIDSVNHVGLAVRDLDAASVLYQSLGFQLTPLSVHAGSSKPGEPVQPMATGNRCAVFAHNYIEVLGIVNPGKMDWGWADFVARFQGAHIICFGCQDAAVVDARVTGNGVKTSGVIALQRDVETAEGVKTARFDCVHFDGAQTPEGLIQAARHRNPEYVHQPRYLDHPNGTRDIAEVVLSTSEPEKTARHYEKLTGVAPRRDGGGWVIDLPLVSRLRFIAPGELGDAFPGSLFAPPPAIVAIGFAVTDLNATGRLLDDAGFPVSRSDGRLSVPAEAALGAVHFFVQE